LHIGTPQANCREQYMTLLCLEVSHNMRTNFEWGTSMEEIAWETQTHFRYDMECNIQGVSKISGYNFKSELSTPKKKKLSIYVCK
jgi:hypothetical protein